MELEWDEAKRVSNKARHNVDFADLAPFFQSERITFEDDRYDYGEVRLISFGLLYGRVLRVVYTERPRQNTVSGAQVRRIISAYPATEREEITYYEQTL